MKTMSREERRKDMDTQQALERQGDALLARHHAFGVAQGVYREADMARRIHREISLGTDIEFIEANFVFGRCRITLAEMISEARLPRRQREAVYLVQRLRKQALVADVMGIKKNEVSQLLSSAYLAIREALNDLEARYPSDEAWRMFMDEIRYKLSLIYRRPTLHLQREKRPKC